METFTYDSYVMFEKLSFSINMETGQPCLYPQKRKLATPKWSQICGKIFEPLIVQIVIDNNQISLN